MRERAVKASTPVNCSRVFMVPPTLEKKNTLEKKIVDRQERKSIMDIWSL